MALVLLRLGQIQRRRQPLAEAHETYDRARRILAALEEAAAQATAGAAASPAAAPQGGGTAGGGRRAQKGNTAQRNN